MKTFQIKVFTLSTLSFLFIVYSLNLYTTKIYEPISADELAQEGKLIWQQKNCTACHQFYGLGGHLGPDLTNVYEKRDEAYIRAFLSTGTLVMPNFNLTEHEKDALVSFLKYTSTTGTSNPTTFKKQIDGTIKSK